MVLGIISPSPLGRSEPVLGRIPSPPGIPKWDHITIGNPYRALVVQSNVYGHVGWANPLQIATWFLMISMFPGVFIYRVSVCECTYSLWDTMNCRAFRVAQIFPSFCRYSPRIFSCNVQSVMLIYVAALCFLVQLIYPLAYSCSRCRE